MLLRQHLQLSLALGLPVLLSLILPLSVFLGQLSLFLCLELLQLVLHLGLQADHQFLLHLGVQLPPDFLQHLVIRHNLLHRRLEQVGFLGFRQLVVPDLPDFPPQGRYLLLQAVEVTADILLDLLRLLLQLLGVRVPDLGGLLLQHLPVGLTELPGDLRPHLLLQLRVIWVTSGMYSWMRSAICCSMFELTVIIGRILGSGVEGLGAGELGRVLHGLALGLVIGAAVLLQLLLVLPGLQHQALVLVQLAQGLAQAFVVLDQL